MESEQSQQRPCPRCGKVRTEGGGSITQWISSCNCAPMESGEETTPAAMCPTCGKRQEKGRSGSFTQWVFRQDLCSCNSPTFKPSRKPRSESSGNRVSWEDAPELPVSADKFPLERYKPLVELGKGAAGTVYLCRDRLLGVKVAIKVLNVLTSEKLVAFQNEARATSKLNHKGIVKILDFGATESGYPYMAMEFFEGQSLEDYLSKNGRMEISMAVRIFTEIAMALQYAHDKEIYHRDIKPSNVLLKFSNDHSGVQSMIIDFGVAQHKGQSQEPTIFQGRTLVGTPQYMPPDQANGLTYDQRSEIYSVGCALFEALTGRPPFLGDTPLEIIGQQANDLPPQLQDIVADEYFPTQLQEVVSKALEKEPTLRYQSMNELSKSIENLSQQETRTDFYQPPATKPNQKRLYWIAAVALVIVGVLGASVAMSPMTDDSAVKPKKKRVKREVDNGLNSILDVAEADVDRPDGNIVRINQVMLAREKAIKTEFNKRYFVADDPVTLGLKATSLCNDSTLDSLRDARLSFLVLASTPITDIGIKKIVELNVKTAELDLAKTKISDACADDLSKIPYLKNLVLTETKISDKFLQHLKAPWFNYLELDGCKIGDEGAKAVATNCTQLTKLGLSSTNVTVDGLKSLRKLPQLRLLMLNSMPIDDKTIDVLKTLKLRALHVTEAKISERLVRRLPEISTLRQVELTNVACMNPKLYEWLKKQMGPETKVTCQQMSADEQFGNINNFIDSLGQ